MASRNFAILVLFAAACPVLSGQTASLSGQLTDTSGAALPNAAVSVTNEQTNQAAIVRTNREGLFGLPSLAPGTYLVKAEAAGFKTLTRSGVKLDVRQAARLDLVLEVGQVSESVEVSAQAAPLVTESPAVESTVTEQQIRAQPLNSRDFNQLVLLAAGAVDNINSGNGRDFGAVAANGNRSFSNDYTVDGAPNNDLYQGLSAIPLSIDVIQEFKVTSPWPRRCTARQARR
jgi:hypothetical protein